MNSDIIIPVALRTIQLQAASISGLETFINKDFEKAVEQIAYSKGRLVVSGIGKSAIIAQKIVATLTVPAPLQFLCMLQMRSMVTWG